MKLNFLVLASLIAYTSGFNVAEKCKSTKTCGIIGKGSSCVIADQACPPCMSFSDNNCYAYLDGGVCPDFAYDCSQYFVTGGASGSSGTKSDSKSASSSASASKPNSDTASSSESKSKSKSQSDKSDGSSSSGGSAQGDAQKEQSGSDEGGGSDMSVVFAIIGGAIGVIAVAIIFLTLVRRSKQRREDDIDEEMGGPSATDMYAKSLPTSNLASSGQYANRLDGSRSNSSGSSTVATYYNQQPPQMMSPHVAGRAIPTVPRGQPQATTQYTVPTREDEYPTTGPQERRESYEF